MASAQSEPSMDEILASIRRIISEDDQDAEPKIKDRLEPLKLEEEAAIDEPVASADDASAAQSAIDSDGADPVPSVDASATESLIDDDVQDAGASADTENKTEKQTLGATDSDRVDVLEEEPVVTEKASSIAPHGQTVSSAPSTKSLLSEAAASQISETFGSLEQNIRVASASGRTVEDLVEVMLAPMIREWLDVNLPRIVEDKVEEEVRRIARRH